jgi:hypothetical protein
VGAQLIVLFAPWGALYIEHDPETEDGCLVRAADRLDLQGVFGMIRWNDAVPELNVIHRDEENALPFFVRLPREAVGFLAARSALSTEPPERRDPLRKRRASTFKRAAALVRSLRKEP